MSSADRPRDICERTFDYVLRAVELFDHLQTCERRAAWTIANQYLRAATSIGSNLEEAQAGESRSDFVHKCAISLKEARESLFWLRLLEKSQIVAAARLAALIQETRELIANLTTIVTKTKRPLRLHLQFLVLSLLGV